MIGGDEPLPAMNVARAPPPPVVQVSPEDRALEKAHQFGRGSSNSRPVSVQPVVSPSGSRQPNMEMDDQPSRSSRGREDTGGSAASESLVSDPMNQQTVQDPMAHQMINRQAVQDPMDNTRNYEPAMQDPMNQPIDSRVQTPASYSLQSENQSQPLHHDPMVQQSNAHPGQYYESTVPRDAMVQQSNLQPGQYYESTVPRDANLYAGNSMGGGASYGNTVPGGADSYGGSVPGPAAPYAVNNPPSPQMKDAEDGEDMSCMDELAENRMAVIAIAAVVFAVLFGIGLVIPIVVS